MTNHNENGNLDSIIDDMLDSVDPVDSKKVEDRLLLAARIGDLIAERKMSKKQFADLMEKEPSVISKWLGGTHNFTQDTLSEISFKLGIAMVEFYREKPAPVVFRSSFDVVQTSGYRMTQVQILPIVPQPAYGLIWMTSDPSNMAITGIGEPEEWLKTMNAMAICSTLSERITSGHAQKTRRTPHPEENTVRKA